MSGAKEGKRWGLGLAVNTVRTIKQGLSAAFNFAVDEKLLPENPVKKTVLPPPPRSSVNPLTIEEAWALVSVKDIFWYGAAFIFCLQTGLRPSELMALIWDDVDFDNGLLRIERACKWFRGKILEFGPVKTSRSERIIELSTEHVEFLKARLETQNQHIKKITRGGNSYGEPKILEWICEKRPNLQHQYKHTNLIFPTQDGRVPNLDGVRRSFKSMLRRAGMTGVRLKVRLYDLRHTHATILLTLGFPDHEVAERLGHTVEMLNNTYAHVYKGRQRMASTMFVQLIPMSVSSGQSADITERINELVVQESLRMEEAFKKLLITQ